MKMLKTLIAVLAFSFAAAAQQNIEWGELKKEKGNLRGVIPFNGSEFYTLRFVGGALTGDYHLAYYNNLQLITSQKINRRVPSGFGNFEDVLRLGNQVVVFISDKKDGQNTIYYQRYDDSCMPVGEPVELLSYTLPKGWRDKGGFTTKTSLNNNFICVEYSIPAKRDEVEQYGYMVLDANMKVLYSGEYETSYQSRAFSVASRYLSDQGDYYLLGKIFNTNQRGKVSDYSSPDRVIIVKASGASLSTMEVELDGNRSISDMSFFTDAQNRIRVHGMYGTEGNATAGIFYMLIDFDNKKVLDQSFNEFTKDFITAGMTNREKERADKREAKGKGSPELYSFEFRNGIVSEDGSMVGVLEQYYVIVRTSSDGRGNISYTYYYHYHDLIVYKIDANGDFVFTKKIQKNQVSVNDYGYYSSYDTYFDGNDLHIFFNDNANNYDDVGNYLDPGVSREIATASYRKKTNTVAETVISLETGDVSRRMAFSRQETDAIAVPKYFSSDPEKRQMLLFLRKGNKEKFGLLSY
jgi:hypothetical protein